MEDCKWHQEIDRRETETFRRFHELFKKGYRVKWSVNSDDGAIWFEHPGGGPNLLLYNSGMIVTLNKAEYLDPTAKNDRDRIRNNTEDDALIFDQWLCGIRLPNWRELAAADLIKLFMRPDSLALVAIAFFGIWPIIKLVWNALVGP